MTVHQGSQDKLTPYQGSPDQLTPYQGSPAKLTPYQGSPDNLAPYQGSPEQLTPYQASPEQSTPYQASPDIVAEQKSPVKFTSPELISPQKTPLEYNSPEQASPQMSPDLKQPERISADVSSTQKSPSELPPSPERVSPDIVSRNQVSNKSNLTITTNIQQKSKTPTLPPKNNEHRSSPQLVQQNRSSVVDKSKQKVIVTKEVRTQVKPAQSMKLVFPSSKII